jgi:iron complex transport system substrate-binding protein
MRIASLLPSATEIAFALGLGDELVGVTHECDYPPAAQALPRLTRSLLPPGLSSAAIDAAVSASQRDAHTIYALDAGLLAQLQPDLVLTQSLCEVCAVPRADVEAAVCSMPRAASVLSLDPSSLDDVLGDIERVGVQTGRVNEAEAVVAGLRERIDAVRRRASMAPTRPRVFCAEWLEPIFCAGHWLPEMVAIAGGEEALGRPFVDSVRIDWAPVRDYAPEVIVLMPCGFDAAGASDEARCMTMRPGWEDLPAVRHGRVFIVDANAYFARPGPRLVEGLEILARLIHPELFDAPLPPGWVYKLAAGTADRFESYR